MGRLFNSNLSYDAKAPIMLEQHRLAELLVVNIMKWCEARSLSYVWIIGDERQEVL